MTIRSFLRLSAHVQMLPILEGGEETLVGGQAVMEGVMMRAPHSYCVAVRRANGEIVTEESPLPRLSEKYPIFKLPILRGLGTLGHAMTLGVKSLRFSMNASLADLAQTSEKAGEKPAELPGWVLALNLGFSLLMFIFMYKFVPLFLATRIGGFLPSGHQRLEINLIDGGIRLALLIVFLYAISLMKDMRRMFQYHGAEHKVVFNFESGQPVNVENAQQFVTFASALRHQLPARDDVDLDSGLCDIPPLDGFMAKMIARIVLLPLIPGVSYELIRFAAKRQRGSAGVADARPGLWLQRITTQAAFRRAGRGGDPRAQRRDGARSKSQGGELVIA